MKKLLCVVVLVVASSSLLASPFTDMMRDHGSTICEKVRSSGEPVELQEYRDLTNTVQQTPGYLIQALAMFNCAAPKSSAMGVLLGNYTGENADKVTQSDVNTFLAQLAS